MVNKIQRTSEQQKYRDKLAQTLRNLRELWNNDLADVLLNRHKNTYKYEEAKNWIQNQNESNEKLWDYSLEHQIKNYFLSKEFEDFFFKLDFDGRVCAIWAVIMYSIAFQDETRPIDYSDCMELVKFSAKRDYRGMRHKLIELIGKRLWVKEWDSNYEQKMKEYIYDKIYKNWYVFHAFNSAYEESIKKNGLSTSIRTTPEKEVRELWFLMRKYNEPFDIYYINWKDSERICFDRSIQNIRDYANRTPEWFWLLVHKFKLYHYGYENIPDGDAKIQYEEILDGMYKFFEKRNVSKLDQIKIKELFDKNRKIYWNWEPRLAMIKLESVDDYVDHYKDFDVEMLSSLAFDGIDHSVDRDIPIEDIKIVHFPKNLKI